MVLGKGRRRCVHRGEAWTLPRAAEVLSASASHFQVTPALVLGGGASSVPDHRPHPCLSLVTSVPWVQDVPHMPGLSQSRAVDGHWGAGGSSEGWCLVSSENRHEWVPLRWAPGDPRLCTHVPRCAVGTQVALQREPLGRPQAQGGPHLHRAPHALRSSFPRHPMSLHHTAFAGPVPGQKQCLQRRCFLLRLQVACLLCDLRSSSLLGQLPQHLPCALNGTCARAGVTFPGAGVSNVCPATARLGRS